MQIRMRGIDFQDTDIFRYYLPRGRNFAIDLYGGHAYGRSDWYMALMFLLTCTVCSILSFVFFLLQCITSATASIATFPQPSTRLNRQIQNVTLNAYLDQLVANMTIPELGRPWKLFCHIRSFEAKISQFSNST